jgi:hypothetical protein
VKITREMLSAKCLLGGVAAVAVALSFSPAKADPVAFTWNPNGATVPLGPSGDAIVNATNYNVSDFSSISIDTNTGMFTEVGALIVLNFLNGGTTVASPSLGTGYSLYLAFNATGFQGAIPTTTGTSTNGQFTSLSYQLIGTTAGSPPLSFAVSNGSVVTTDPGTKVVLAYGNLVPNTGFVTLTKTANGYSPTANVNLTFNECLAAGTGGCTGNESGFFVSPATGLNLEIGNFSATDSVTTLTQPSGSSTAYLNLNGGSGNLTYTASTAVPEPSALAVFGVALLGLTMAARRRTNV